MHPLRYEMAERCWVSWAAVNHHEHTRGELQFPAGFLADPFSVGILAGGAAGLGYPRVNSIPQSHFPKVSLQRQRTVTVLVAQLAQLAGLSQIPDPRGGRARARARKWRFQSGLKLQQSHGGIWLEKAGNCSGVSAGTVPGGDSSAQGHLPPGWAHTDA